MHLSLPACMASHMASKKQAISHIPNFKVLSQALPKQSVHRRLVSIPASCAISKVYQQWVQCITHNTAA